LRVSGPEGKQDTQGTQRTKSTQDVDLEESPGDDTISEEDTDVGSKKSSESDLTQEE
jgi:hypothetical protein